jgi:hypothetical protein
MPSPLTLGKGRAPWLPTAGSHDLRSLLDYDIPLVGMYTDGHQRDVLFVCVTPADGPAGVWVYTEMPTGMAQKVDQLEFDSALEIREYALSLFAGRPFMVGLSIAEKLLLWAEYPETTDVGDGVADLLRSLQSTRESLDRVPSDLDRTLVDA